MIEIKEAPVTTVALSSIKVGEAFMTKNKQLHIKVTASLAFQIDGKQLVNLDELPDYVWPKSLTIYHRDC